MRRFLLIVFICGCRAHAPAEDAVTRFATEAEAVEIVDTAVEDPADVEESGEPGVPVGNMEKGDPPDPASAEAGARLIFDAIRADDPAVAEGFFFPAPAFDLVKNMEHPSNYHRKLVRFFEEDVHAEHGRYTGISSMQFERFEMGGCTWKEPFTQGNRLAYWSCRRSRILVRSGDRLFDFRIDTLINWGATWFVIHLGPARSL